MGRQENKAYIIYLWAVAAIDLEKSKLDDSEVLERKQGHGDALAGSGGAEPDWSIPNLERPCYIGASRPSPTVEVNTTLWTPVD